MDDLCACSTLAEHGDFDGEFGITHDSRCAARLRPLLEECLERLLELQIVLEEDDWRVVADLRRELGKEERADGFAKHVCDERCNRESGHHSWPPPAAQKEG